jgi:hypothetical protein
MTPPGKRVQLHNAPGSETGPGIVATWGKALADKVDAMGFKFDWNGRSSTFHLIGAVLDLVSNNRNYSAKKSYFLAG